MSVMLDGQGLTLKELVAVACESTDSIISVTRSSALSSSMSGCSGLLDIYAYPLLLL